MCYKFTRGFLQFRSGFPITFALETMFVVLIQISGQTNEQKEASAHTDSVCLLSEASDDQTCDENYKRWT